MKNMVKGPSTPTLHTAVQNIDPRKGFSLLGQDTCFPNLNQVPKHYQYMDLFGNILLLINSIYWLSKNIRWLQSRSL